MYYWHIAGSPVHKISYDHDRDYWEAEASWIQPTISKNKFTPYPNYDLPPMPRVSGREPHKCPICEGKGKVMSASTGIYAYAHYTIEVDCHACKGTGIVWS